MIRRWWWILLLMAVVGPLLGLLAAAVVTYVMPKKYESAAVVQVNLRTVELPGSAGGVGGGNPNALTPQFFGTQFEVIKSRKVLQQVVDALDLTKRWGVSDAEAIQTLKNIIVTQNIRGTELIAIRVRHSNAEDARKALDEFRKKIRTGEVFQTEWPRIPIIIHEEPTLARRPSSPNVALNLVLGAVAGLPFGLLLAFPLMWIADRLTRANRTAA